MSYGTRSGCRDSTRWEPGPVLSPLVPSGEKTQCKVVTRVSSYRPEDTECRGESRFKVVLNLYLGTPVQSQVVDHVCVIRGRTSVVGVTHSRKERKRMKEDGS